MKDIHFIFDHSTLGSLTVIFNDFKVLGKLREAAIRLAHTDHEPYHHITARQYGMLLLKTCAYAHQGLLIRDEEVKQFTDADLERFAVQFAGALSLEVVAGDSALESLHEKAKADEHFYQAHADKINSPFSLSTTLASLYTTEQPVGDTLRTYWQNDLDEEQACTSQKLKKLISLKKRLEKDKHKDSYLLDYITDLLHEQNESQFRRDIETKRTVNRNFRLAVISLVVGLSNLAFNIIRLFT